MKSKSKNKKYSYIGFRPGNQVRLDLQEVSKATGKSLSEVISFCIRNQLPKLRDMAASKKTVII
jgi:hypothetical protein